METGRRFKVSSDRLVKPEIEPATPGLQGKRFIHYTTAAPPSYMHMDVQIGQWFSAICGGAASPEHTYTRTHTRRDKFTWKAYGSIPLSHIIMYIDELFSDL